MQRDLVEAARRGDHEAFEVLATAAADRLYAIARLILRDTHQAEDAVQEALTRAWRELPRLRDLERWPPGLIVPNPDFSSRRYGRALETYLARHRDRYRQEFPGGFPVWVKNK